MSNKSIATIATMGIDIGKNSFHVVGLDRRGAIVLRQKWSRGQVEARLAAMPPCLIGMEACVGAHQSLFISESGATEEEKPDLRSQRRTSVFTRATVRTGSNSAPMSGTSAEI